MNEEKSNRAGYVQSVDSTMLASSLYIYEVQGKLCTQSNYYWSEWRLTVIAATVRIALVDILDLSEVDIPAGGFLYPAVGWG